MKPSSILGIVSALAVLIAGILMSTKTPKIFLDTHAIVIVIGGTLAASFMCFPLSSFVSVGKAFAKKFLGNYGTQYEVVIAEIVDLARGSRSDPNYLKTAAPKIKTIFLRDAVEILVRGGVSDEALEKIMKKRSSTFAKRYEEEALIFKTISKFPPAFGLMGTTLGMIALLQNLGSKDAFAMLGPSMSIGLVATFYGIAIANLLLIPLGENLTKLNKEDATIREMAMDGIRMLRSKEHPIVIEEYLKSYLLPSEREALLKKGKVGAAGASS